MKIMILVPGLPIQHNKIKGGVHSAVYNLLEGFANMPIQVRVVSFNSDIDSAQTEMHSSNIEICYEPEGKWPFHSLNYLFNGSSILQRHLAAFQPDVVHFEEGNSFYFVGAFLKIKQPKLVTIHGNALKESITKTGWKQKITWVFNGLVNLLFQPKNIVFLSEISKQQFNPTAVYQTAIIPNAIKSVFFRIPVKEQTDNRLLYIGVINNRKNILLALQTIVALRNKGFVYTLDVVGGYEQTVYEQQITKFIQANQLENLVHFHGWVNQDEIIQFISDADILIMTSLAETLPMVIAEAKSAGKLVVSSAVGGIATMIEDGVDGYLFDIEDSKKLFDTLMSLHNNHALVHRISMAAKTAALQKCSSNSVADQTIGFYHQLKINQHK